MWYVSVPSPHTAQNSPVPQDGLRLQDGFAEELTALGAGIETHPAIGNTLLVSGLTSLRAQSKHRLSVKALHKPSRPCRTCRR